LVWRSGLDHPLTRSGVTGLSRHTRGIACGVVPATRGQPMYFVIVGPETETRERGDQTSHYKGDNDLSARPRQLGCNGNDEFGFMVLCLLILLLFVTRFA
jgi:hypothetical protein